MLDFKVIIPAILLFILSSCTLSESKINQRFWELDRPIIYYVEISDMRHGEIYRTTSIISENEVIHVEPMPEDDNISLFTVDEIFVLAHDECGFYEIDCSISYNDRYHYISELAIFDWRVIRVEELYECQSVQECVQDE